MSKIDEIINIELASAGIEKLKAALDEYKKAVKNLDKVYQEFKNTSFLTPRTNNPQ